MLSAAAWKNPELRVTLDSFVNPGVNLVALASLGIRAFTDVPSERAARVARLAQTISVIGETHRQSRTEARGVGLREAFINFDGAASGFERAPRVAWSRSWS